MQSKYRLIMCADDDLNSESVTFLDADDDCPASDFIRYDEKVVFDGIIYAEIPGHFPTGHTLVKE